MRKPDPTRFTGRKKPKADKLEMKGFSIPSPLSLEPPPPPKKRKGKSETSEVTKLRSSEVTELRSYGLPKFDQLRRLDIRLTWEQKRFLDDWEEDIRQAMPEGDRGNPDHRRITKNSIIRVLVEIVRQLEIRVNAKGFHNEGDLLEALFEALSKKLTELQTSEVPKLRSY